MKKQKNCYIDEEIINDIESNPFFNFSEWIEKRYYEEFMQDQVIEKLQERILILKKVKTERESLDLTKDELRFFVYENGFKNFEVYKEGLLNRFNNTYGKKLSLKQFEYLKNKYRGNK